MPFRHADASVNVIGIAPPNRIDDTNHLTSRASRRRKHLIVVGAQKRVQRYSVKYPCFSRF